MHYRVPGDAETAAAKVSELEAEVERQTALVVRLEEDLLAAEHSGQGRNPTANGTANGDMQLPLLEDSSASGTCFKSNRRLTLYCNNHYPSILPKMHGR